MYIVVESCISFARGRGKWNHPSIHPTVNCVCVCKGMPENDCSAGEASDIYSIEACHSAYVDAMIALNSEGTNTDDPSMQLVQHFITHLIQHSEALYFFLMVQQKNCFSHCWYRLNSRENSAEKHQWRVSAFTTMCPYITAMGGATTFTNRWWVHYFTRRLPHKE
jgi:hypothetical protein